MFKKTVKSIIENIGNSFNKSILPANKVSALELVQSESRIESANFIRSNFSSAVLFDQLEDLHNYIITQINKEGLILEFGVYTARSTKRFSKKLVNLNDRRTIYGFDSFEGLEENWCGQFRASKGGFKVKPPRVPSNVELIIGPVQETLETFLNQHKHEKIAFAHFDMDTYTPTKFVLEKTKNFFDTGTVILFDELYGYPNWQRHEHLALSETLTPDDYEFIVFGPEQCAIRTK